MHIKPLLQSSVADANYPELLARLQKEKLKYRVITILLAFGMIASLISASFFLAKEVNTLSLNHLIKFSYTVVLPYAAFFAFCIMRRKILDRYPDESGDIEESLSYKITGKYSKQKISCIEKLVNKITLYVQYYLCRFEEIFLPSSNYLKDDPKIHFIAPAYNRGQEQDIHKYIDPRFDRPFSKAAGKEKITVTPNITCNPFEEGVCFGSNLLFAKKYFERNEIEKIAKLFSTGTPEEGVLLQAKNTKLFRGVGDFIADFESNVKIRNHATIHLGGMTILKHIEALDEQEGVFHINVKTPWGGRHGILVIKENNTTTLFDSNYGTASSEDGHYLIQKAVSKYEALNAIVDIVELGPKGSHTKDMMWGPRFDTNAVSGAQYGGL